MLEVDVKGRNGRFKYAYEFSAGTGISVIWGISGAGKSTLLRVIAGLDTPETGSVEFSGSNFNLPVQERQVGYVPQNQALFPHMSVRKNLGYANNSTGRTSAISIDEIARLLEITDLLDRYPASLSGGEKQRVALGRAMLSNPKILLLDEPFSGLDETRIAEVSRYIRVLNRQYRIPVLLVTHSIRDVARLADQVIAIVAGQVSVYGSPEKVLPELDTVSDGTAILSGVVNARDEKYGLNEVAVESEILTVSGLPLEIGMSLRILASARDVVIAKDLKAKTSARNQLTCKISGIRELADMLVRVELHCGEQIFFADITRKAMDDLKLKSGEKCLAMLKSVSLTNQVFER